MPLVPGRQILNEALKGGYGVGAFNVNNMEQIQAIMTAASETQSPVFIQASRGALKYANLNYLRHLMLAAVELNPDIPVAMHLDHGNGLESAKTAVGLGFSSVMIDGSLKEDGKTPTTFEENVDVTRKVVEYCHQYGVSVEGELGTLGGIEDGVGSGQIHLTDPNQAIEFIAETGLDYLALAIGTSHGAYKFKVAPKLAMDIVQKVRAKAPEVPLVMHGSSTVPADLRDAINHYGGKMPNAMGVPIEAIQEGIRNGVAKINIDTDGRMAITAAIRKIFVEEPSKFDPREYLTPAREAHAKIVAERMKAFGAAGHAKDYKPMTLAENKA
ncbi:MAG: ketose-bisphosphate aldolase, partial [bacterium]